MIVSGPTANPDAKWVTQQARNASAMMADGGLPATYLLLDHDAKFTASFDAMFEADGTEIKRVGPTAPNLNAYIDRFVQTWRTECLDHFLVCGRSTSTTWPRNSSPIITRSVRIRVWATSR